MNIKGKKLCDNCFAEIKNEPCEKCGYKKSKYKQEIGVLAVGTVLKQRYHIGKVLGRGGFGITYKAYDALHEEVVAIKEYYPNGIAQRQVGTTQLSVTDSTKTEAFNTGAEKFFEEAKTVSRFNGNPNIVGVYEFFYENSTVYYVMEYLEGCDLKTYIKNNGGKISQGQIMTLLNVITDALFITHSLNVLHRDISPDNIYIQKNGDIKLIDFGAARQVLAEQSKSLSVILKQGFAPFEQYQRKGKQGAWTDIYALGATCFYALTGKVPDDATDRMEDADIGTADEFGVDEALWSVLGKCLAVKTADRYQSVLELKEALAKIAITPMPFVMEKEEKIPLTVAVAEGVTSAGAIGATVAVSENAVQAGTTVVQKEQDKEKEKSPFLLFFKSVKGIVVIAAILVVAIIAVAVAVIASHGRKNDEVVNNDGITTTNNISKEDTLPVETDSTTENDTTENSTTEEMTTTELDTESSGEGMTEPTTPEPTQPPTTVAPTQPPTTVAPTQPPTTVAPTTEAPTEETYVMNRYCFVDTGAIEKIGGYYTGEWVNNAPNGRGYLLRNYGGNDVITWDCISVGTWNNGVWDKNKNRADISVFRKVTDNTPGVDIEYWGNYMDECVKSSYLNDEQDESVWIESWTYNDGVKKHIFYFGEKDRWYYEDYADSPLTKRQWDGYFSFSY